MTVQIFRPSGGGGGSISGSGTNGRIAQWNGAASLTDANLIGPASNLLTLAASSSGITLTVPETGTAALLATANVFTAAQTARRDSIGTTSTDALILENTTAAAAGAQQYSPRLRLTGQGWKTNATAASQTVDWTIENQPLQSTVSPKPVLVVSSQANAGGYNPVLYFVYDTASPPTNDQATFVFSNNAQRGLYLRGGLGLYVGAGGTATAPSSDGGTGIGTGGIRTRNTNMYGWVAGTDPVNSADTALARNAAAVVEVNNGTAGQWASLKAGVRDSGTNTITDGLTLGHQSSGTPAAGLGIGIQLNINSTTTADQNAARITAEWTTATHASRKALLKINVYDTASREVLRGEADGSNPLIGFLGATAVARQSIGAAATDAATTQTLANNIRTALINLGLATT